MLIFGLVMLSACVAKTDENPEGIYRLINMSGQPVGVDQDEFERGKANFLGTRFEIERFGDSYRVQILNEENEDAILFYPESPNRYRTKERSMLLELEADRATITAMDGAEWMQWELEKE